MKTWTLIGIIILSTGCNYNRPKDQSDNSQTVTGNVDFTVIQSKILQPYCITCHSSAGGNAGGINLENYSNVMHYIEHIQNSVALKPTMPPGNPLSPKLQQLLITWISNGSPEHSGGTATTPPEQQPPSEELKPTFSSISKNIFAQQCVFCHGPGGSAEKLPVLDYDFLLKSMWIVPGDLGQSSLYDSLNSGRMPPGGKLTQAEIDTIGTWITDGAKND